MEQCKIKYNSYYDKNRLEFLDAAKGIGIIAVLVSHAGGAKFLDWIVPYYMQLFFTVSGLQFGVNKKNLADAFRYAKQNCREYFKWSIIILILYVPLFFYRRNDIVFIVRNIWGILYARKAIFFPLGLDGNIIMMEIGNSPLWYLACVSLAWIVVALFLKIWEYTHLAAVGFLATGYILCVHIAKIPILLPWSMDTCLIGAIFIIYGMVLEKLGGGYRPYIWSIWLSIYIFINSFLDLDFNMSVREYGKNGINAFMIVGIVGSMMLLCLCKEFIRYLFLFCYIGRHTIFILCLHSIIYKYYDLFINYYKITISNELFEVGIKSLVGLCVCVLIIECGKKIEKESIRDK